MKKYFFFIIFFIILFEIFSFISTKFNLLLFNNNPIYSLGGGNLGFDWRNEKEPWGAWHKINYGDRHKSICFDVQYKSNNVGARDDYDYTKQLPKDSIILIGDSLAEGWGVEIDNIFSKIIEKKTGRKVLNFGASGNFGPVQQYLLYSKFAKNFPHNELIYLFSPVNDFTDNDGSLWTNKFYRYRPYFKKNDEGEYYIFYPANAVKSDNFDDGILTKSVKKITFKEFLARFTYSYNTLRTVKYLLFPDLKHIDAKNRSYYYNSVPSIDGTLFFVDKLLKAPNKKIKKTLIISPTYEDISYYFSGREYKNLYWYKKITDIANLNETRVLDLMDYVSKKKWLNNILTCDPHWNKNGHEWAAESYINFSNN